MPTILIIGKGPAGISAALYSARANVDTIVIGRDGGALNKASKMKTITGLQNPLVASISYRG